MSVYSNKQIKEAIKTGHIVFYPYQEEHINGSSVDVTLGEWYYRTEKDRYTKAYNPFSKEDVDKYFDGPHRAEIHKDWCNRTNSKPFKGIPEDHPIIVLKPGERILAHTHEFIGIKAPGTSTMQARSTWGRNGVAVCLDAGWGDPGYINRWTMEIYNMNQHESVVLPVGERIAQLVFYETGEVEGEYASLSGKYQSISESKVDELISSWHPTSMLPKSYKDSRREPAKLNKSVSDPQSVKEIISKLAPDNTSKAVSRYAILDILRSGNSFNKTVILKNKSYNYLTPPGLNSTQARHFETEMNSLYTQIESIWDKLEEEARLAILPFAQRFEAADINKVAVESIDSDEKYGNFTDDYKKLLRRIPSTEAELLAEHFYPASDLGYEELLDLIKNKGYQWQHKMIKENNLVFGHVYEVNGALSERLGENIKSVARVTTRNGYRLPEKLAKNSDAVQSLFDKSLELYSWLISEKKLAEAEYAVLLGHRNRFIVESN